jgi:hypothetical protein
LNFVIYKKLLNTYREDNHEKIFSTNLYRLYITNAIPDATKGPTGTPLNIISPTIDPNIIGITTAGSDVSRLYPFWVNNITNAPLIIEDTPIGDFKDTTTSSMEYLPWANGLKKPIVKNIRPILSPFASSLGKRISIFKSFNKMRTELAIARESFFRYRPKIRINNNIM